MLFSVIFNIVAKAILFLLTIIIARFFGSNIKTDIYFFIYGSMLLLSGFINNIDIKVLIPESMHLRQSQGDDAANSYLNYFLRLYTIIGIGFIVSCYFFSDFIFSRVSRFPDEAVLQYRSYFILGAVYFSLLLLTNYLNNILSSLKFFTVPMIISGINSCIVIAGIFLFHDRFDVVSVLIAAVVAHAINLIILIWLLKKYTGWKLFRTKTKFENQTWSKISFASLGQIVTVAGSFFPLYLLSGFGQGIITLMNYGKNISDVPGTLITSQLTNVTGIQMNEEAANGNWKEMDRHFVSMGRLLLFLLIPIGCFLFLFPELIIQVIYSKAELNAADLSSAAEFLRLFSITLFSIGVNALVSRVFIAQQAIRQSFLYQIIMGLLMIAATWILTHYYGAYGYPYAVIAINCTNFFSMYVVCRIIVPHISYYHLLFQGLKLIVLNAVVSLGIYYIAPSINVPAIPKLIVLFLIYAMVLVLLNVLIFYKEWYIRFNKFVLKKKFLPILSGPLKGYQWSLKSSYDYIWGTYEAPETIKAFSLWMKPGVVFYDLGANAGYYSFMADHYAKHASIYAFEPVEFLRDAFDEHLKLNEKRWKESTIRIVPYAISDRSKEVEFSDDPQIYEGNTYVKTSDSFAQAKHTTIVQSYSVDELIDQGYEPPTVMKIDVEGAEYDVLLGAVNCLKLHHPKILLATHDCHVPGVKDQCLNLLKEFGYTILELPRYNKNVKGLDDFIAE
jgi:FkbM family methyltransferase